MNDYQDRQIACLTKLLKHYQKLSEELQLKLIESNATIEKLINESDEGMEI